MSHQAETATPECVNIGDSPRILVLEPTDVLWLGIQQMLNQPGIKKAALWRIRTPDELGAALRLHLPNVLLLTSVGSGTAVLSLLKQLSTLLPLHPNVRVMAFL
ncbi:hypothetical protein [Enterobacillus tribolii]|uniref:Response regulatory domain-containing protein n=1 Tax=Enterobacillus tribolii TaxID=1487935 RepID=A0A370QQ79_9GAMM|nr:hypothetical protein [Enterobacillus tribolii]MBW7981537.1 hypothetical protein [Enterobacillus tribolii]RDK90914.1 hypothetical protein C8D90_105197 [Enterobacillus tribolii]